MMFERITIHPHQMNGLALYSWAAYPGYDGGGYGGCWHDQRRNPQRLSRP